jgi:RND family efflux transporter MFP subunit
MPHKFKISLLCILFAGLTVCGCTKSAPPLQANLPTVRTVTASLGTTVGGVTYSVSLVPNRQADLAFKSGGIVDEIRNVRGADGRMREITMGDAFTAGETLARVRTADYSNSLDQTQAQLRDYVARAESSRASLTQAENDYSRATHLYQEESMTKSDFDHYQQEHDAAIASVHQADADVVNSKAAVAQAELALHDTALVAPFSGVVVSRQVELGNLAGSSATAFTVADISLLKADFSVPDTTLPTMKLGREVTIRISGGERELPARITAVSPSADQTSRVFTVEVTVPNPGRDLKPGIIGSIEINPAQQAQPRLLLPINALVRSGPDHGFAVFVLDTGAAPHAHLRPVQIGESSGGNVQILRGVNSGEHVVTDGAQILHDNDPVGVLE